MLKLRNHPFTTTISISTFLLSDRTLVESKLITLQDVSVTATALAGARGNHGVQTAGLELSLDGGLDLAVVSEASSLLLLDTVALLLLLGGLSLGLASPADGLAVVSLVPLSEGGGVNLDDGRLGEGVGTDQFVVRRVVHDTNDTGLAGNALRSPREVAGLETEGTELLVTTTGTDKVDSLVTKTGVGGLATLVERSVGWSPVRICSLPLCFQSPSTSNVNESVSGIPLLAVEGALRTGGRALVTRVARNTHVGV